MYAKIFALVGVASMCLWPETVVAATRQVGHEAGSLSNWDRDADDRRFSLRLERLGTGRLDCRFCDNADRFGSIDWETPVIFPVGKRLTKRRSASSAAKLARRRTAVGLLK